MREILYDVFARKDRGDPLSHIGYVDAFDEETAKIYALTTYSEQTWFEMCVVERSSIIPVTDGEGLFAQLRRARNE
jgi:1,2-phenylacetyl-CoA epoxidase PaaB subunit